MLAKVTAPLYFVTEKLWSLTAVHVVQRNVSRIVRENGEIQIMKKCSLVRTIVLWICLVFSVAYAYDFDFSAMSIPELQEIITTARKELNNKTAQQDGNIVLVDDPNSGILVYLTGKGEKNTWYNQYDLEAVFVNNTDNYASVDFRHVCINGWEVDIWGSGLDDVGAAKKKKGELVLDFDGADITAISEIEEVEFYVRHYNPSSYETVTEYGPIILYYDGERWSLQ